MKHRPLINLCRNAPPPPDQFAVRVSRSESLQIRHGSLDCLGLQHSAFLVDQVTWARARLSHRAV